MSSVHETGTTKAACGNCGGVLSERYCGHNWQVWESNIDEVMKYIFQFTGKPVAAPVAK
jgi:hypothetical protein